MSTAYTYLLMSLAQESGCCDQDTFVTPQAIAETLESAMQAFDIAAAIEDDLKQQSYHLNLNQRYPNAPRITSAVTPSFHWAEWGTPPCDGLDGEGINDGDWVLIETMTRLWINDTIISRFPIAIVRRFPLRAAIHC